MISAGAVIKKIVIAKVTDPKVARIICGTAIGLVLAIIMPVLAVVSVLNGSVRFDTEKLNQIIEQRLEDKHGKDIVLYNDTMQKVESALKKQHLEKFNTLAEVLFLFYLSEKSEEKDFVKKYVSCFDKKSKREDVVKAVSKKFKVKISTEDLDKLMKSIKESR